MAIHPDAEAHAQDALLARRQACERLGGGLTQIGLDRRIEWRDRFLVLDEVAQAAVLLLADRHIKAKRLLGDIQHLPDRFRAASPASRQALPRLARGRSRTASAATFEPAASSPRSYAPGCGSCAPGRRSSG